MIPPKIKKLPKLHKIPGQQIKSTNNGYMRPDPNLYMKGARII